MAVSKRLRYEVLRRDNHTCRYCGATAPDVPLRVDHVTPVALGGGDDPANLATACEPCNSGKTSSTPDAALVAGVSDDALRWATAMEQAAGKLLEQEQPKLEYREAFLAEWNRWGRGSGKSRKPLELPSDWKASIETFRTAGLPQFVWADIVDGAMGNEKVNQGSKFKYCAGIAWKKIRALQDEARRIVSTQTSGPTAGQIADAVSDAWAGSYADRFGVEPTEELMRVVRIGAASGVEMGAGSELMLNAAICAASCGDPYFGVYAREDPEFIAQIEEACFVWRTSWRLTGENLPDGFDIYCFRASVAEALSLEYTQYKIIQQAARTGAAHGIDLMESFKSLDVLTGGEA